MKNILIFGIILSCLAIVYAAKIENCGTPDDIGKFTDINVEGCKPDMTYCLLKKGKNATIDIKFQTNKLVEKVHARVWGRISGLDVPFGIPNPDGCTSGVKCPVQPNVSNEYQTTLFVERFYPKIQLIVKWELLNESDDVIICALIPAQIR